MTSPDDIQAERRRLGVLLRQYRNQAGLTQEQLARRTGYKQTVVSDAETARRWCSEDYWQLADHELGAGGRLISQRRVLAELADEARSMADRAARQRRVRVGRTVFVHIAE